MTGRTLNHYKIVGPIGKGGMGEVYAAEDLKLSRTVALKVLPAALADNPDRRMRFEREARAIAALNHPNIVTIHSVEEADGVHFITMEMVQGKPLSELIPREGLRADRLLALALAVADAIGAAHRNRPPGPEAAQHRRRAGWTTEGPRLRPREAAGRHGLRGAADAAPHGGRDAGRADPRDRPLHVFARGSFGTSPGRPTARGSPCRGASWRGTSYCSRVSGEPTVHR